MALNGDLRQFHLTLTSCNLRKQWSDAAFCGVWSGSVLFANPGFTDNPLYTALWRHSVKKSAARNNRYLDCVQTAVWFHWSVIGTWIRTLRIFSCMRLDYRLDYKQSTQKVEKNTRCFHILKKRTVLPNKGSMNWYMVLIRSWNVASDSL